MANQVYLANGNHVRTSIIIIVNWFRKPQIEREYGITYKQRSSGNPTSNALLEIIHSVLGNIVQT